MPETKSLRTKFKIRYSSTEKLIIVGEDIPILFTTFHLKVADQNMILTTDQPMMVESRIRYKKYYYELSYGGHKILITRWGWTGKEVRIHCGSSDQPRYELTTPDKSDITKDQLSEFISDIVKKCIIIPKLPLHKEGFLKLRQPTSGMDIKNLPDDLFVELLRGYTGNEIKKMSRRVTEFMEEQRRMISLLFIMTWF